ncbi:permease for cytosine/purines, uracil, thiamine, allantoin-domain-containing protein [Daldinia decipiens]|uniref:permease for cytosine/purines, uracil, thiamine, allantoin-domain-containing protein n=1 Tax=Daldinia decipiens TaxID=326647 RepID=UPI0020C3A094|nr:permease for cytosine/purines, uracil, thiamine, allantoin-domain-containing protein [Daldinia decipiens]KAI1656018.1 permease for cytosine/purines, uracil, thiamine, allantoin-domain-containing protein [Daldinia decipiens]
MMWQGEHSRQNEPISISKDVEKTVGQSDAVESKSHTSLKRFRETLARLILAGPIEDRGVMPVSLEDRTATNYSSYFSIWACMNINLLPITFGMLGPTYGLSLRDCSLVIIFFCILTASIPAYLGTLGPKTGLRQMIQARFSFGRYLVSVPVILNLATLTGFCVVTCVIGGQCLSAVAGGSLTPAVGIVIMGVMALLISFCGYDVLHQYERFAWIPALVAIIITTGCGGTGLVQQAPAEPATAGGVLSFGMIIASYMIPYACLSSDFTTYLNPKFSSARLFLYGYAGLIFPSVLLMVLGASIGGAINSIPEWEAGYESTQVGGVLAAMLSRAGGFGKFVVVVLSLTLLGNIAATMYSITLNFQILIPQLVVVPRYMFSVVITAIVIPVSIRAAVEFMSSLENFVALIGYWSAAFVAVVIIEHNVFRGGKYDTYDHDSWNVASRLPWGIAALTASALSFALVIPSMSQVWFEGPIAKKSGDIGFEMAFAITAILYLPLRYLEKRLSGR